MSTVITLLMMDIMLTLVAITGIVFVISEISSAKPRELRLLRRDGKGR